jgi:NAD(P)-dependent dehydrogenase (short-subunit alcohol dehydrogenase family)
MKDDAGRTVLVTGGARRLGRAIALDLAAAGWQVAVHYRGSLQEAEATAAECGKHAAAQVFQADLGDEAQVRALVPAVVQRFGRLDAVVNNASRFEHDDARSFGMASFAAHMAANTAAPVLLAQALARHLDERNAGGAVVNLLDQKLWNPNPDFLSYTLSKAALESATTLLAQALAPRVRVVGVAPGLTLTSHLLPQEKFEQLHKLSPLGRSSTPEDIAHAVRFALENGAITGTTLLVDGGQHLMKFDRDFSLM